MEHSAPCPMRVHGVEEQPESFRRLIAGHVSSHKIVFVPFSGLGWLSSLFAFVEWQLPEALVCPISGLTFLSSAAPLHASTVGGPCP